MNGIGAHEVIYRKSKHIISLTELDNKQVEEVLWTYRDRLVDLRRISDLYTDCFLKM